jgi:hypothetical protein
MLARERRLASAAGVGTTGQRVQGTQPDTAKPPPLATTTWCTLDADQEDGFHSPGDPSANVSGVRAGGRRRGGQALR